MPPKTTTLLRILFLSVLSPTSLSLTVPSPFFRPASSSHCDCDVVRTSIRSASPLPFGSSSRRRRADGGLRRTMSLTMISAADLVDPLLYRHVVTGGALAFAGDLIAQSLLSNKVAGRSIPPKDWDVVRTFAFVAFGAVYTGGAQHFIFAFLNGRFSDPLVRLALAQFFFIPFCYYPMFLFMVPALRAGWEESFYEGSLRFGFLQSKRSRARRDELFSDVASRIPSTLVRNWCFWLPVQFIQFNYVPKDLQVTFAAAFGVIWNAILSWSTAAAKPGTALPTTTATAVAQKEALQTKMVFMFFGALRASVLLILMGLSCRFIML